MNLKTNKTLGGILLICGTTIGAGMLALPVSTGLTGFLPSMMLFICCWILMTYTAFLLLEVNLWMKDETNMITMASRTLGLFGRVTTATLYLLLLYCLTTAYLALSGPLILDFSSLIFGLSLPKWVGPIPLIILFGYFVYKGTAAVDSLNRYLMGGMVVTFIFLFAALCPHIDPENFYRFEPQFLPFAASLIATSFGFHIIIPTLSTYLNHDLFKLVKTLLIGSLIPLLIYVIWLTLTLGILPIEGKYGILKAFKQGESSTTLLTGILSSQTVNLVIRCFSLFAIVTSFLGVSLSLWDFLTDACHLFKLKAKKAALTFLTFTPPLIFTLARPRIIFDALEIAGAFGVIALLALLPALMVWSGRYRLNLSQDTFRAPGGKPALIGVITASCIFIILELLTKWGVFEIYLQSV